VSGHKARVSALQTVVAGSPLPPNDVQRITTELTQVYTAGRVRLVGRRLLLQVLHSTRALDSTLAALILAAGGQGPTSLGNSLNHLRQVGLNGNRLTETLRIRYQNGIVRPRNVYMHQAGAYPANTTEVGQLLADMQACLVDAINLW